MKVSLRLTDCDKEMATVVNTISSFTPANIESIGEAFKRYIIDYLLQYVEEPQEEGQDEDY